jgi:hypothetical protein
MADKNHHFTREYQKSKVYKWEHKHLHDGKRISFADAQAYVNEVWASEGLKYPPIIQEQAKQTRKWAGAGNREGIWIPIEGSCERVLLHELAHTLTMTIHGAPEAEDSAHGADFVGMYIQLVSKYMGKSQFELWYTAKLEGVKFEMFVKPKIDMNL